MSVADLHGFYSAFVGAGFNCNEQANNVYHYGTVRDEIMYSTGQQRVIRPCSMSQSDRAPRL
jgi:hypothetical protein